VPGSYRATLTVNGLSHAVDIEIRPDPRIESPVADLQAQFDFTWSINRKLTDTHQAITRIRKTRSQLTAIEERVEGQEQYNELAEASAALKEELKSIEETLYQTKMEARQDPLNFPIRLNDKLAGVMRAASFGDHPPSASTIAVRNELVAAIDEQLAKLESVLDSGLSSFNDLVANYQLPAVAVEN
jgi:DNA-binding FrmR family transcriptional regulator